MKIFTYLKKHSVVAVTLAIVLVVAMTIAGRISSRNQQSGAVAQTGIKQVGLVDVSTFRNDVSTVSADGIVESLSQVDLKAQVSAPLSVLNVSVGDSVYAGEVIAQLQNADLSASLDQAKASLALAKGQYNTGSASLDSVKKSAIDTMRNSFVSADTIVRGQIDQFLFNTVGGQTPLSSYVSDYKLLDYLRSTDTDLASRLPKWKQKIDGLSVASTDADITLALAESKDILDTVSAFLGSISVVLSDATQNAPSSTLSTLEGWKATVSIGRNTISGSSSAITAADSALANSLSSHGSPAEAQISIAAAGVAGLQAQIAKTIIKSPIAGQIAALPLRVGELASPGTLLATVVGGGGLDIKAYVSGEDIAKIKKDARATLANGVTGTVLSVAPSVNELNKKVEVKILIDNAASSGLVVGQSVPVSIRSNIAIDASSTAPYRLPIQNVKIVPGDAFVFTVGSDSKIIKNKVVLDSIDGDFVIIKSGITADMKIVSPVYELEEGQTVEVAR